MDGICPTAFTKLPPIDCNSSQAIDRMRGILRGQHKVLIGNVNALRAKRPAHKRHAPTVADTQLFLQTISNMGGLQQTSKLLASRSCWESVNRLADSHG